MVDNKWVSLSRRSAYPKVPMISRIMTIMMPTDKSASPILTNRPSNKLFSDIPNDLVGQWNTTVGEAIYIAYKSLFLGYRKALVGFRAYESYILLGSIESTHQRYTVYLESLGRAQPIRNRLFTNILHC